jgi:glycosyltransferase involved in cell wall biosynthesis
MNAGLAKVRRRRTPAEPTSSPRPRILFVINSLAGGGAERVMTTLLAYSKTYAIRFEIALAVLDDQASAFEMPDWLTIIQLDCKGRMLASISGVERVVGEYDPDLTVSFLTRANFASGVAMLKRRKPWIISERTSTPAHLGSALRQFATKLMMRFIYPRASRVIAVSEGVATKLSGSFGVRANSIQVIANPVDVSGIKAAARAKNDLGIDEPYIMAFGRLVNVKNYALLIRAFAKSALPCRLVIAGEGPERAHLLEVAAELGISDRVLMPGWLSNPYPALRHASIFALTSDIEGFPNALVEALALGVPAVATNCPDGPAEILAGMTVGSVSGLCITKAGILAPPGEIESCAEALRLAFQEPLRRRLVEGGRERANDYSAATIAARYWDVIERELATVDADRASRARGALRHSGRPKAS